MTHGSCLTGQLSKPAYIVGIRRSLNDQTQLLTNAMGWQWGYFAFMAIESLGGSQLWERLLYVLTDAHRRAMFAPLLPAEPHKLCPGAPAHRLSSSALLWPSTGCPWRCRDRLGLQRLLFGPRAQLPRYAWQEPCPKNLSQLSVLYVHIH